MLHQHNDRLTSIPQSIREECKEIPYTEAELKLLAVDFSQDMIIDPVMKPYLLKVALKRNLFTAAKIFLKREERTRVYGTYEWAIKNKHYAALKFLSDHELYLKYRILLTNREYFSLLHMALYVCAPFDDWHVPIFLVQNGCDVSFKDSVTGNTALHVSVSYQQVKLTKLLIEKNCDINSINRNGYSIVEQAINHGNADADILRLLVVRGAKLPLKHGGLKHLAINLPKIGEIEVYDEQKQRFTTKEDQIDRVTKHASRPAVLLCMAVYDHSLSSENFGAIRQYYSNDFSIVRCYKTISKNFLVFRVLVATVVHIRLALQSMKEKYLSSDQCIKHLMIHSHASSKEIKLSHSILNGTSIKVGDFKNEAMVFEYRKIFNWLSSDATIALFGCNTAYGPNNITEKLSEISSGRVIFGGVDLVDEIRYKSISTANNNYHLLPFFGDRAKRHLSAYRMGAQVAHGEWQALRSRL